MGESTEASERRHRETFRFITSSSHTWSILWIY